MTRWTPTEAPPPHRRWQSRQEILREYLDSLVQWNFGVCAPSIMHGPWGWDFKKNGYAVGRLEFFEWLEGKAGFKLDQPRWPKGSGDDSGRWSGGAGTASPGIGHNSGQATRGGHHFVPRKIFDNEPLRPETRKVFEDGVTGPLRGGRHQNSKEHSTYNEAVYEHYQTFLHNNGIRPEEMTPEQNL